MINRSTNAFTRLNNTSLPNLALARKSAGLRTGSMSEQQVARHILEIGDTPTMPVKDIWPYLLCRDFRETLNNKLLPAYWLPKYLHHADRICP